ncbi:MAG: hypothetical protein AAGH48_05540, partial [Pseudomonadota bacterium]
SKSIQFAAERTGHVMELIGKVNEASTETGDHARRVRDAVTQMERQIGTLNEKAESFVQHMSA